MPLRTPDTSRWGGRVLKALGPPLWIARVTVPLPDIEQRLAGDITSDQRDDLRGRRRRVRPLRASA
jgi:hypothetical protein